MDKRIPVTILTGDSGAGKTTLRNHILAADRGRRFALILNDLSESGEIGVDGKLIRRTEEELFEVNSGCVCCTIRGDLIRAMHGLLQDQAGNFDAVIIETTGAADPGPVIQTFFVDHILEQHTRLDSVATVVDANHIAQRVCDSRPALQQVAFADQIVLNKTGLLDEDALLAIEARLRRINPLATFHRAQCAAPYMDIALDKLLDRAAFDLARGAALALNAPAQEFGRDDLDLDLDLDLHLDIGSISLRTDIPMDFERVGEWLAALVTRQGADILHGQGVIDVVDAGEEQRRLGFQSVHMLHEGSFQQPWAAGEERGSRLVFIGRNLDRAALQTGFMSCAAAGVSSNL